MYCVIWAILLATMSSTLGAIWPITWDMHIVLLAPSHGLHAQYMRCEFNTHRQVPTLWMSLKFNSTNVQIRCVSWAILLATMSTLGAIWAISGDMHIVLLAPHGLYNMAAVEASLFLASPLVLPNAPYCFQGGNHTESGTAYTNNSPRETVGNCKLTVQRKGEKIKLSSTSHPKTKKKRLLSMNTGNLSFSRGRRV